MAVFILIPLCWGLLLGLITGWAFHILPVMVLGLLLAGSIVFPLAFLMRSSLWSRSTVFIFGLCIGIMVWWNSVTDNQYQNLYGSSIQTQGQVMTRPTITSSGNQALVVKPDGFTQNLRVSLFHHAYIQGGERVLLEGTIKQPENFNEFNYVNYLKEQNVYAELSKAKIIVIGQNENNFHSYVNQLRRKIIHRAELVFNEESSAIVLGMLIGKKDQLPGNVEQSFQKVGLIHILVVSGFNLTIIALGIGVSARLLGRRLADFSSLVIIWLFVILVGSSASVVRAGVMASLFILARLAGRLALSRASLLTAVVVMSVLNPWQLFYSIGFQLSIAATYGVLEANALRVKMEREGWLSEIMWSSIGAIIATAPIIALYFGTVSLLAPIANLIILPQVPYLMLFGTLALFPYLQRVFIPLTETIINAQLKTVEWLAKLPFSQLNIEVQLSLVIAYYVIIIVLFSVIKTNNLRLKDSDSHVKITKIII